MEDKIDKIYDLLEKVHIDLQETKNKVNSNSIDIKALSNQMIKFENESNKKLDALLDGYKQAYEKLQEHDKRFDSIEEKLVKHDVEIRVFKGGKE